MNKLGTEKKPFLFLIDFLGNDAVVYPLDEAQERGLFFKSDFFDNTFSLQQKYSSELLAQKAQNYIWKTQKPDFEHYQNAFSLVQKHLQRGDSYLLNLSAPTQIETDLTFEEIFLLANAKYKIFYKNFDKKENEKKHNEFMCFSPESFIKISAERQICTFPMKGTINADVPDAQNIILENQKELAEHYTIVDLMRNDLSQIAKKVRVKNFRYIEKIITQNKNLLQVSSHIEGILPKNYHKNLGTIFQKLLPAGSISGAPKPKTLSIIQEAEQNFVGYNRNFYTGVGGVYNGNSLESCVMIRFLEKSFDQKNQNQEKIFFKSGGGITAQSILIEEYQELCDKVYLPF